MTEHELKKIFKKFKSNISMPKIEKAHKVANNTLWNWKRQGYEITLVKVATDLTKSEKKQILMNIHCEKLKECFSE